MSKKTLKAGFNATGLRQKVPPKTEVAFHNFNAKIPLDMFVSFKAQVKAEKRTLKEVLMAAIELYMASAKGAK